MQKCYFSRLATFFRKELIAQVETIVGTKEDTQLKRERVMIDGSLQKAHGPAYET